MPYTPNFDTVVSREAAWFALEPAYPGCPPLLIANGGLFDVVQGYPRKVSRRARELYIWREETLEERIAFGEKAWRHRLTVAVLWPPEAHSGSLEADLQKLDTALAAVYSRIRGPQGDKTHGGAFWSVGEDNDEIHGSYVVDPLRASVERAAIEWHCRYSAIDTWNDTNPPAH